MMRIKKNKRSIGIMTRLDPQSHAKLKLLAWARGMSLDALIIETLQGRVADLDLKTALASL